MRRRSLTALWAGRPAYPERLTLCASERIFFTKHLSLYLRSGIPMFEALALLSASEPRGPHARLLESVLRDIQHGRPLSIALSRFPRAYSSSCVQLIAIGETSGTLPDALSRLSHLLSKRAELHRMVLAALAYPAVILAGTCGVIGLLMLYVFPRIVPLLIGLHVPLPFATRVLLRAEQVSFVVFICLCGFFVSCILAVRRMLRDRRMRLAAERVFFPFPLIGGLAQGYVLSSLFYSLHVLLASGARLDYALSFARMGTRSYAYRDSLTTLEEEVLGGQKLSTAIEAFPKLYPRTVAQMIAIGETTGTLSESMEAAAHLFEETVAERAKTLSLLLEPALMLCMGLAVGFVAFAIITPMYAVTQHLSS